MPVHDWAKVDVGLFHHFHQMWTCALCDALNGGLLPPGYSALIEFQRNEAEHDAPRTDAQSYAARANLIGVRTRAGGLHAALEVVSPGNKDCRESLRALVAKTLTFLARGVHVLIVDPLPPTLQDPNGIHGAIWDAVRDNAYTPPPDRPLTLASYVAASEYTAYVEAVAIGQPLPDIPLFVDAHIYVIGPLEATYLRTWDVSPKQFKEMVLHPERFPDVD